MDHVSRSCFLFSNLSINIPCAIMFSKKKTKYRFHFLKRMDAKGCFHSIYRSISMQNKPFSSVVIYTPEKFHKRHQVSTSAAILLRMLFTQKFCTFFCKLGNFYALLQGHLTCGLTKNSSLSFSSNTHQEINVGMKQRKVQLIL